MTLRRAAMLAAFATLALVTAGPGAGEAVHPDAAVGSCDPPPLTNLRVALAGEGQPLGGGNGGGGGGQTPVGLLEDLADSVFGTCTGAIRPGVRAWFDGLWHCTLGWVVEDEAGARYIATAGHCNNFGANDCGAALTPRTITVEGVDGPIGTLAYSTGNCGPGDDFALIRIDPAHHAMVDPTMCHWGGPQALQESAAYEALLHYGWGVDFSHAEPTRARAGLLDPSTWTEGGFLFVGAIDGGDSGSPLMAWDPQTNEGRAVGVITHSGVPLGAAGPGPQFASRVDTHLARAGAAMGHTFTLVTSTVPVDVVGYDVPALR